MLRIRIILKFAYILGESAIRLQREIFYLIRITFINFFYSYLIFEIITYTWSGFLVLNESVLFHTKTIKNLFFKNKILF